jgi:peptide/nickel transport system substrate-binding protein
MHFNKILVVIFLLGLAACNQAPASTVIALPTASVSPTVQLTAGVPEVGPTATLPQITDRLLTICLGREPASLFYYDATSTSARDILAAVYDGPVDIRNYTAYPVILEKMPSLADGDARLESVQVNPGDLIVDASGNPVNLEQGVEYRPSGCSESACTEKYAGDQPIQMDQLVIGFKLLPGIQWSDGVPLTAADSVYSYELGRSLYPTTQPDLILRTQSYRALDESSIEWTGLPGFQDGAYYNKFFIPLPQHVWQTLSVEELRTNELSTRKPLGWGAYVIDEWIAGDHISMHKNPLYFRAGENLPYFDNLVFRFVGNADEALDALQAGECDFIDQTAMLDPQTPRLAELVKAGQALAFYQDDAGWEQLLFGVQPIDSQRTAFFADREVRQAVAMCIDRSALVSGQAQGSQLMLDSYTPASNPLHNPDDQLYGYDPQQASALLEAVGWHDADNNPATPRIAEGVAGVTDGASFNVQYMVSEDEASQEVARKIQGMLGKCGIEADIVAQQPAVFLAPGPDGPVFGRSFDLAQFAWASSLEPPCYLYLTAEIPGPYPEFAKGWAGVNASGYSNPQFDQACEDALFTLPDSDVHQAAHFQAQEIYSAELPSLPLFSYFNVAVARPDFCNYTTVSALDSPLWNLEAFDYGSGCSP